MATKKEKTKEDRINQEKNKLNRMFKEIEEKKKKTVEKLVMNAAFMAISLEDLQKIINEKGYTEEYQNGANQRGVKKCSEVEIYNTMIKNYSSVIKQLTDLLPKDTTKVVDDGFEEFVNAKNG